MDAPNCAAIGEPIAQNVEARGMMGAAGSVKGWMIDHRLIKLQNGCPAGPAQWGAAQGHAAAPIQTTTGMSDLAGWEWGLFVVGPNGELVRQIDGKALHEIEDEIDAPEKVAAAHEVAAPATPNGGGVTAAELMAMELPDPQWIVRSLIVAGLTILAGAPKVGKSWAALQTALAVTRGASVFDHFAVDPSEVLYIALEDNDRRMKRRLKKLLGDKPAPQGLHFEWQWPRLDNDGFDALRDWLDAHPQVKLVIIDTVQRLRGPVNGRGNAYQEDYAWFGELQRFALERGIAIVGVHHLRKSLGLDGDVLDQVSGSVGVSGAADTVILLRRSRAQPDGTLFITGRDVEEAELSIRFDRDTAQWSVLGDAAAVRMSEERKEVIDLLKSEGRPMTIKEIALSLDGKEDNIKRLLYRMKKDGELVAQMNSARRAMFDIPRGDPSGSN
jgi:hypothetical protein